MTYATRGDAIRGSATRRDKRKSSIVVLILLLFAAVIVAAGVGAVRCLSDVTSTLFKGFLLLTGGYQVRQSRTI